MAHGCGESDPRRGDAWASPLCSAPPGAPPAGNERLHHLLGVEHTPVSAARRRRHRGAEEKRAKRRPETDENPGDQSGRVDAETGGMCRATQVARRAHPPGTHDRPGTGCTPREPGRVEKSFGIAVLASLLVIRACHQASLPGTSWRMAQRQHAWRLRIIRNPVEHT